MIEINDIYKTFGNNKVLQGISAKFRAGKNNLIIGGSGSGQNHVAQMHSWLTRT
jgi:phospholipid/cholesterol/gamma-HCH transport system ATP-binding protein